MEIYKSTAIVLWVLGVEGVNPVTSQHSIHFSLTATEKSRGSKNNITGFGGRARRDFHVTLAQNQKMKANIKQEGRRSEASTKWKKP